MDDNPLLVAAARGDDDAVIDALARGANLEATDMYGSTALAVAAGNGHADTVALLLARGALVNASNNAGGTALMVAATGAVATHLVNAGADLYATSARGVPMLARHTKFGRLDVVDVLLERGVEVPTTGSFLPLLIACAEGHAPLVSRFLAFNDTTLRDSAGATALHRACQHGSMDVLRLLGDSGPLDIHATDNMGATPLHYAARGGHCAMISALLDRGAGLESQAKDGSTPLLRAAVAKRADAVELLAAVGANVHVTEPATGWTALHFAASKGDVPSVQALLHAMALVDAKALSGATPMRLAQSEGHEGVVQLLHAVRYQRQRLHRAAALGDMDGVRAGLSAHVNVNEVDGHGNSLLHLAVLGGHMELLRFVLDQPGVRTTLVNQFNETAITIAIKMRVQEAIQALFAATPTESPQIARDAFTTYADQPLGRGAFGSVYKGSYRGHGVAIKTLLPSNDGGVVAMDEVETMQRCASPYIISLEATSATASGDPILLLEYMDQGSVHGYLQGGSPGTYSAVEIAHAVARALQYLHAQGLVHRDIKSDNVLLSSTKYIKLGDLGIARGVATNMTVARGTPGYRAPEVLREGGVYDKKADIYSFGVLLTELDTKKRPFWDKSWPDALLINAVMDGVKPTLSATCDPWYSDLAHRCLAFDPDDRPTADELVLALTPRLQSAASLSPSLAAFEAAAPQMLVEIEPEPAPWVAPNRVAMRATRPAARVFLGAESHGLDDGLALERTFVRAAAFGDIDQVHATLAAGVHPDCADIDGMTALELAIVRGHVLVAVLLIDSGAAVADEPTQTAMVLAIEGNHPEVLDAFARRGMRIDMLQGLVRATIVKRRPQMLQLLLDSGAISRNAATTRTGKTLLHFAAEVDDGDAMAILLDTSVDEAIPPNAMDDRGATPLHAAAAHGALNAARALIPYLINVDECQVEGMSPLGFAVLHNRPEMVTLLLQAGADANRPIPLVCEPPLMVAVHNRHAHLVTRMVEHGVATNVPSKGTFAVLIAIDAGDADTVAALLRDQRVDVNDRFLNGETMLHYAVKFNKPRVVTVLLAAGASVHVPNGNGRTPLFLAEFEFENSAILELFAHAAYDRDYGLLHTVKAGHYEQLAVLLQAPFDRFISDNSGNSMVHIAVLARNNAILELLLRTPGVEHDVKNFEQESPLTVAIKCGFHEMAQTLFAKVRVSHIEEPVHAIRIEDTSIGRGAYGSVHLGVYQNNRVAVKIMQDANAAANEIRALSQCNSPYVVQLLAVASNETCTMLVLEYMAGGDVRSYLNSLLDGNVLKHTYTNVEIAWVVANALRDLHAIGVVHRDIKSHNVLLSHNGYIKLGDLGIARDVQTTMTDAKGTYPWMAPELLMYNNVHYGPPIDIYAFGVLLTELDTRQLPYTNVGEMSSAEWTRRVIAGDLRPSLTRDAEPWLRDLATQCLQGDATKRPTAAEIVATLEHVLHMAAWTPDRTWAALSPVIYQRDIVGLAALLDSGMDPNFSRAGHNVPLTLVAGTGNSEMVSLLLQRGAHVNAVCANDTPLMAAVRDNYEHTVALLLDAGANPDYTNDGGESALSMAICDRKFFIVGQLVHAGASTKEASADMQGHHSGIAALVLAGTSETALLQTDKIVCHHCHQVTLITPLQCRACGGDLPDASRKLTTLLLRIALLHDRGERVGFTRDCPKCWTPSGLFAKACARCEQPLADTDRLRLAAASKHLRTMTNSPPSAVWESTWRATLQSYLDETASTHGHVGLLHLARHHDNPVAAAWLVDAHERALVRAVALDDSDKLIALLMQQSVEENRYKLLHVAVRANSSPAVLELLLTQESLLATNDSEESPLGLAIRRGYHGTAHRLHEALTELVVEAHHPLTYGASSRDVQGTESAVLGDVIGQGPTSCVFHGTYQGRHVAVKSVFSLDASRRAAAIASVSSPYVLDAILVNDALILEYMDLGTLQDSLQILRAGHVVRVHVSALAVAWVVANALRDLHECNIVHGAICAHNVFLSTTHFLQVAEPRVLATPSSNGIADDVYALGVLLASFDAAPHDAPGFRDLTAHGSDAWRRNLMAQCMAADVRDRPSAAAIVATLQPRMAAANAHEARYFEFCSAIQWKNMNALESFLGGGFDINAVSLYGEAPLVRAADADNEDILRLLLRHGANVHQTCRGLSLFEYARQFNKPTALRLLSETAFSNAPSDVMRAGSRPPLRELQVATIEDAVAAIRQHEHDTSIHASALVRAVTAGDVATLRSLLATPDVSPNGEDAEGNSLAHLAVRRQDMACLRALLATPGVHLRARDKNRWTPIALALFLGQNDMVRALHRAQSTEPLPVDLNALSLVRDGERLEARTLNSSHAIAAIAAVSSPCIVPVVAFAAPNRVLVASTRLPSLRVFFDKRPPGFALKPALSKLKIAYIVASALADAHAQGVVHGHVSSHNVFLVTKNFVHLGVPGTSAVDEPLLRWMAPDVLDGAPCSEASDIYAFGVLLSELDTFALPFGDDNFEDRDALRTWVVDGGMRPELSSDCDAQYASLVRSCWHEDPGERPVATDLVALLWQLLADEMPRRNA